jgi:hypothetical protein
MRRQDAWWDEVRGQLFITEKNKLWYDDDKFWKITRMRGGRARQINSREEIHEVMHETQCEYLGRVDL